MIAFRIQNKAAGLLALDAISRITANTLAGIDKNGLPFKAYSSRPFAAPSGAFPKRVLAKLEETGELEWFRAASGGLWVVVLGGYAMLKKLKRPGDGGKVNLSDTGRMLGSLTLLSANNNKITIGFTRREEAEKMQHNISIGRNPMGLPPKDWDVLIKKHSSQLFELIEI